MTSASPDRPFDQPWHAQAFALTHALVDKGAFSWPDWTEALSATLKRHGQTRDLDGSDDYYLAWLDALEGLLTARGLAAPEVLAALKSDWEAAYLSTPHGAPVHLKR